MAISEQEPIRFYFDKTTTVYEMLEVLGVPSEDIGERRDFYLNIGKHLTGQLIFNETAKLMFYPS